MKTSEMTTAQLKAELESIKKDFDCQPETWDKVHAIEDELTKRNEIKSATYDF